VERRFGYPVPHGAWRNDAGEKAVTQERPFTEAHKRLKQAGLRLTKQRLALGRLLFDGRERHVTAETVHQEANEAGIGVSLATVYNTLHQFTDAGLLRQVIVGNGKVYFDTNVSDHHHFHVESDGKLIDIPGGSIEVRGVPHTPFGTEIERVDVIVRLKNRKSSAE